MDGKGRSVAYGLFIPLSKIKIGFTLETEAEISVDITSDALVEVPDPPDNIQRVSNTYEFYKPKNLALGFTGLLTEKIEVYFEYNRYFYSTIYSFDRDIKDYALGVRYQMNKQLLTTIGYYKITEHYYDNTTNLFGDYWNKRCINLGLVYNTKLFIYDLGYAIDRWEDYFLNISISYVSR